MGMDEYVADANEYYQQPYGERDKATNPGSKVGNVKGISRIHAGNGLIMTIAWNGKGKRSHTMWLFKIYSTFI